MAATFLDAADSALATTLAYSISAGSDRLLVVAFGHKGNNNITEAQLTATYGGQAMTRIVNSFVNDSIDIEVAIFILDEAGIAAASGTTISVSNSVVLPLLVARSCQGVDQTTPVPETNTDGTPESTPNPMTGADIVAADDSIVMSANQDGQAVGTAAWGSDLTELVEIQNTGGSQNQMSVAGAEFATGQTAECRCTWGGPNRMAQASIEIAAVAAGGGSAVGKVFQGPVMRFV